MEGRANTVRISAPRAKAVDVERAGAAELADSKRYWRIDRQESDLTGQLVTLEDGTRKRNREFEAKIRAIEERLRGLESKLSVEMQQREEEHVVILEGLRAKAEEAVAVVEEAVAREIAAFFLPGMDEQAERVVENTARVEEFIKVTVPRTVDEQSGTVTRRLQKAHETFDIENAKIAKREQKILQRCSVHVADAAQSFADEKATRMGKLALLGEDIEAVEQMDDREEETLQASVVAGIKSMRAEIADLSETREAQDCIVLDSLAAAQERLQNCILETFGAGPNGDAAAPAPATDADLGYS